MLRYESLSADPSQPCGSGVCLVSLREAICQVPEPLHNQEIPMNKSVKHVFAFLFSPSLLLPLIERQEAYAQELVDGHQMSAGELVDQISDPNASSDERRSAFHGLFEKSPHVQRKALFQVLESGAEGYPGMAAQQVIKNFPDHSKEISERLVARIGSMPVSDQVIALHSIASLRPLNDDYFEVARTVAKTTLDTGAATQAVDVKRSSPLDLALRVLAHSERAGDQEIVRNAIVKYPQVASPWWVYANSGVANSLGNMAIKVYENDELPLEARVAAATSIAPTHEDALQFVADEVRNFINTFGRLDLETLTATDQPPGQSFRDLDEQAPILKSLYFLPPVPGEALTFSAIQSRNVVLRIHSVPVATIRWPEKLLELAQSNSELQEPALLAGVVYIHPGLESRVKEDFPEVDYHAFLNFLKEHGPTMLSPFFAEVNRVGND